MYLIKPWNTTFLIHQSLSSMINVDEIQILQFILKGFFLKIDSRKTNKNYFNLQPCRSYCTIFFFFFKFKMAWMRYFQRKTAAYYKYGVQTMQDAAAPFSLLRSFFFFSFKLQTKNKSLARA